MPYSLGYPVGRFDEDESPIRTSFPVSTLPTPPPITRPGHAGGTIHDPTCSIDLRNILDIFIK